MIFYIHFIPILNIICTYTLCIKHSMGVYKAGVIISNIIDNKIKYLLVKSYNDIWSFPKGHVLQDEDFSLGASRELFEETGIEIDPVILLNCKFKILGFCKYFILNLHSDNSICIPNELNTNTIPDNIEISGIDWVSIEDINNIKVNSSVRKYVKKL